MTNDELVQALDAIDGRDPEDAHAAADGLLLQALPAEVREAYDRVVSRAGAWWYA